MYFNVFMSKIHDFESLMKYSEKRNYLCGVVVDSLINLPYWTLKKEIPDLMKKGSYERAMTVILKSVDKRISLSDVIKSDNYDKCMFLFFILDQFKKIERMEKEYLSSTPDAEWLKAGINELNILEDFNLIDHIAEKYRYTHEETKYLSYGLLFDIQLREKILRKVERKRLEK